MSNSICMCDFHMRFRRWFWHRILGHKMLNDLNDGLHTYCACGVWFAKTVNGLVQINMNKPKGDLVE